MIKLFWTSLLMLAAWACPGAGEGAAAPKLNKQHAPEVHCSFPV